MGYTLPYAMAVGREMDKRVQGSPAPGPQKARSKKKKKKNLTLVSDNNRVLTALGPVPQPRQDVQGLGIRQAAQELAQGAELPVLGLEAAQPGLPRPRRPLLPGVAAGSPSPCSRWPRFRCYCRFRYRRGCPSRCVSWVVQGCSRAWGRVWVSITCRVSSIRYTDR